MTELEGKRVLRIEIDDLIEVELEEDDDFLKVRETLTRIGVASRKERALFQSCHILHKRGKYYIVHFKELFALDGKPTNFSENDIARRNTIANLLAEWGLLSLTDAKRTQDPIVSLNQIKIISYQDKKNWDQITKYNIGRRNNNYEYE